MQPFDKTILSQVQTIQTNDETSSLEVPEKLQGNLSAQVTLSTLADNTSVTSERSDRTSINSNQSSTPLRSRSRTVEIRTRVFDNRQLSPSQVTGREAIRIQGHLSEFTPTPIHQRLQNVSDTPTPKDEKVGYSHGQASEEVKCQTIQPTVSCQTKPSQPKSVFDCLAIQQQQFVIRRIYRHQSDINQQNISTFNKKSYPEALRMIENVQPNPFLQQIQRHYRETQRRAKIRLENKKVINYSSLGKEFAKPDGFRKFVHRVGVETRKRLNKNELQCWPKDVQTIKIKKSIARIIEIMRQTLNNDLVVKEQIGKQQIKKLLKQEKNQEEALEEAVDSEMSEEQEEMNVNLSQTEPSSSNPPSISEDFFKSDLTLQSVMNIFYSSRLDEFDSLLNKVQKKLQLPNRNRSLSFFGKETKELVLIYQMLQKLIECRQEPDLLKKIIIPYYFMELNKSMPKIKISENLSYKIKYEKSKIGKKIRSFHWEIQKFINFISLNVDGNIQRLANNNGERKESKKIYCDIITGKQISEKERIKRVIQRIKQAMESDKHVIFVQEAYNHEFRQAIIDEFAKFKAEKIEPYCNYFFPENIAQEYNDKWLQKQFRTTLIFSKYPGRFGRLQFQIKEFQNQDKGHFLFPKQAFIEFQMIIKGELKRVCFLNIHLRSDRSKMDNSNRYGKSFGFFTPQQIREKQIQCILDFSKNYHLFFCVGDTNIGSSKQFDKENERVNQLVYDPERENWGCGTLYRIQNKKIIGERMDRLWMMNGMQDLIDVQIESDYFKVLEQNEDTKLTNQDLMKNLKKRTYFTDFDHAELEGTISLK